MNLLISELYIFAVGVIFIVIPVIIGIYVYRDAARRGMNATLWTLIAVLAPTFIGLIVYLIVRADHTTLQCPNCKKPVTENYSLCPHCGTALKIKCAKCGNPLEAGWTNCSNCGEQVPEDLKVPVVEIQKDKGLGKILLAVILIPLLVVLLLVFGLVNFRKSNSTNVSSTGGMSVEDFAQNTVVSDWLKTCDAQGDGTYVLAYELEMGTGQPKNQSITQSYQSYIIYRTGLTSFIDSSVVSTPKRLFKESTLRVEYTNTDAGTAPVSDYAIDMVEYTGPWIRLEIYENGNVINYNLEMTDAPISIGEPTGFKDIATNLFAVRLESMGDNLGVINLIDETGLSWVGPYSIEQEIANEPYGLRIAFDSVLEDFEVYDFSSNAIELLGLIENLEYVEFTDGEHSYTLPAEEASQILGYDVKELGQSQGKLEEYLQSLQGSYE